MQILILGFSSICRRRVLPALAWAGLPQAEVASVSHGRDELRAAGIERSYASYQSALDCSEADIVYISTVNSVHRELAEYALRRGFHVVVDKPAFLSERDSETMLRLAQREGRCLAEAVVFTAHPRVVAARALFRDAGGAPSHIVMNFSFPSPPLSDFRLKAELGGGAVNDLGPYAIASGKFFFDADPVEIIARRTASRADVDSGFAVMATYPGGRTLLGVLGYETAYVNQLQILGAQRVVSLDRVFSPPGDMSTELVLQSAAGTTIESFAPAHNFGLFFRGVIEQIQAGNLRFFDDALLSSSWSLDRIRADVGVMAL